MAGRDGIGRFMLGAARQSLAPRTADEDNAARFGSLGEQRALGWMHDGNRLA